MDKQKQLKLAQRIVKVMLEFWDEDPDVQVNGFDDVNRRRLIRVVDQILGDGVQ